MKIEFDTEKLLKEICKIYPYCYSRGENKLVMKRIVKKYKGKNTEFAFPLKIKIDPSVVGLIVGEGYIDERQFVFSNSNENVIRLILDFIFQFDIQPKVTLEVATKNITRDFIIKAKNSWEEIIRSEIEKIRKRKEFNNTTEMGTLHLRYHNSCFAKVLQVITNEVAKKAEVNRIIATEYIKGVIAAEGNVNVKKRTRCLYMIRISAKRKSLRTHYKKCLRIAGIEIYCKDMPTIYKNDPRALNWKTGRGGAVLINRWINFYKILSINLLDIHEDKKRKFIKHFMSNKTTKWLLEFKGIDKKWFSMNDMRNIFKLKSRPRDRVIKMLDLNFIESKIVKPKDKHPRSLYCLTNNYFKFIDKLSYNAPSANG